MMATREPEKLPKRVERIALLAACCFFCSTLEFLVPKPLPFFRLGLANLPILIALTSLPKRDVFQLVVLKIIGQSLITGTLFSYVVLFSSVGGVASALVMLLAHQFFNRRVSLIGISILGAMASNISQLVLARFFIFGEGTWYIAPFFLGVGLISASLLGALALLFCNQSQWYKQVLIED